MARRPLDRLLRPRSLVLVGGRHVAASLRTARRAGFDGLIAVVNPTRDEVGGIPCIRSIADLPFVPDAALVALSPERSIGAVAELAALGVGGAVVISSGFRETGTRGAALESRLSEAAGQMALIGPNCLGVINQFDGAAVFGDDVLARRIEGPGAAIVSQSGAFMIGIACVERAFPLGYAISVGNQARISHADCIEALLEDPRVRAIGLYLEGIDDGVALGRACWRAATAGVPVVALKGGDGALGAEVAQSHTAALVVDRAIWEAFATRFGIREVTSLKALVETLKLLSVGGVPRGPAASILSFSGGLNGQVARAAGHWGIDLPPPRPDRAEALGARLPDTITVSNPLDLNLPYTSNTGASLEDEEAIADIITDLAEGVADQVAFILDVPPSGPDRLDAPWLPAIRAMVRVRDRLGVPAIVAGILPEGLEPALRERILADGLVPLGGFAEAIEAMGHAAAFARSDRRVGASPDLLGPCPDGPLRTLDEMAAKAVFAAAGLAVPRHVAATPEDAPVAAQTLAAPLAVKALSTAILHKAAMGGVALSVGPGDVGAAVHCIRSVLAGHGHDLTRILIEEMIPHPQREFILGARRDCAMGLVMIIGDGGAGVERSGGRVHTLLLPLEDVALDRALAGLGLPAHAALRRAATDFAALAVSLAPRLETAEINPLILTANGDAVAADAVIQLRDSQGETP